jgi:hypothetical protein
VANKGGCHGRFDSPPWSRRWAAMVHDRLGRGRNMKRAGWLVLVG